MFAHAILNANPYAFLDDAPLEERRSRAVQMGPRGARGAAGLVEADLLSIDPAAIDSVLAELAPEIRDADELHDHLLTSGAIAPRTAWAASLVALRNARRATSFACLAPDGSAYQGWVATERVPLVRALFTDACFADDVSAELALLGAHVGEHDAESAAALVVGAYLRTSGPATVAHIALALALRESDVSIALARLESDGQVLQGRFDPRLDALQYCERGLLQRIHRRTLGKRRAEVRAMSQSELYRFLLRAGKASCPIAVAAASTACAVIEQLEGVELPAAAWERDVLPARVADYDPAWLDQLCLSGEVAWGRLRVTPPDPEHAPDAPPRALGAYGPSGAIALFLRAHGDWLVARSLNEASTPASTWSGLSPLAREVAAYFERRGAAFLVELEPLAQSAGLDDAIWELVRHGVLASDGFDGLRTLLRRRDGKSRVPARAIGRWSLIHRDARPRGEEAGALRDGSPVEHAWLYLRRYGIVTRDLLTREVLAPPWRELALVYRRLEARGEIRGGRFVTGLRGEQFALGEALELVAKLAAWPGCERRERCEPARDRAGARRGRPAESRRDPDARPALVAALHRAAARARWGAASSRTCRGSRVGFFLSRVDSRRPSGAGRHSAALVGCSLCWHPRSLFGGRGDVAMTARLISSNSITAIGDPAHAGVRKVLEQARSFVDEWLLRVLPEREKPPSRLHDAMKYAVIPGGGRARPLLCRLVADVYGGGDEELVGRMAAAVELVHCASLVQDDLPCFDDASMRRGRPVCHKEYGEATAILVGDALLTLAFETLANAAPRQAATAFRLVHLLTNATGSENGIIGGQALELEPHEVDLHLYHRQKTAALFRAAAAGGAICCGVESEVARWARIGELIGVALQLRDDLEDVESSEERTGKTCGRDQALRRPNAVLKEGVDTTRSRRAVLIDAVRELLGPSTPETEALHLLVQEVTRPRVA